MITYLQIQSVGKLLIAVFQNFRIFVIFASLGFEIVKPKIGYQITGIGLLYLVIASIEAVVRVMKPKNDSSHGSILAGISMVLINRYKS